MGEMPDPVVAFVLLAVVANLWLSISLALRVAKIERDRDEKLLLEFEGPKS